jgi:enterochelin esterase-like enzyme
MNNSAMSPFFTLEEAYLAPFQILTVKSPSLKRRSDITVFHPKGNNDMAKSLPLVLLLHGVYGSHWAWSLKGKVHLTLQRLLDKKKVGPMVLAMPSDGLFGDGSAYIPHKTADYEQWIVQDVIAAVKEKNRTLDEHSPIFIAGLSMGGYGALRLGAKYPHIFNGFSGLSSITHFEQMSLFLENMDELRENARINEGVLEWMLLHKKQLPPFRFDCGVDDLLIEHNRILHRNLLENDIPHIYEENEGKHEWDYWAGNIERTLLFFDGLNK